MMLLVILLLTIHLIPLYYNLILFLMEIASVFGTFSHLKSIRNTLVIF